MQLLRGKRCQKAGKMKLEKSQIREEVHIFYCKDNYPLHTLMKSMKEPPTKIEMHCMPKTHAVIQP